MYGDFSRLTFAVEQQFSAVLLQQGRVSLDADWNEHAAIVLHLIRGLAADVIGPFGGPRGHAGFEIAPVADAGGDLADLKIGAGDYWVDGIRCSVSETAFRDQPYCALTDSEADDELGTLPLLVYLRVFERWVSAVEVPAIRETALGGLDTAGRAQIVWQVLATGKVPGTDTAFAAGISVDEARDNWPAWSAELRPNGVLRARAKPPAATDDPCVVPPESRYRGPENQLYRVEIHTGGDGDAATFTFSRDNGSSVFPILHRDGADVTLATLGPDPGRELGPDDWVELVDDNAIRRGTPEALRRVERVDPLDRRVTLNAPPPGSTETTTGSDPLLHPFLRRWDRRELAQNPLKIGDGWIDLEDGVQVEFDTTRRYRRGDHWLIPARVETGDVEWPQEGGAPAWRDPTGVIDHLAPLAIIRKDGGALAVGDVRCIFNRLACPPP